MDRILVDTHSHIDLEVFDEDRDLVIQRLEEAGIKLLVCAAFDLTSSQRAVELAATLDYAVALVGIHPHHADQEYSLEPLQQWLQNGQAAAIGEIGLDYYRNLTPKEAQKKLFREQLALARELDLPVIIHDREAHGDILEILRKDGISSRGGILHCFSGSWEMAQECLKMGFYLSFGGPVTYPNSVHPKEAAARCPLERLLTETDCPYLPPQPRRGKRNEPAYVAYVLEEIAALRQTSPEELGAAIWQNGKTLFGL